jgi:glutathione-regulated potassium-efflux system ancillary protein KefC
VFQGAAQAGVISATSSSVLVAAVALSMLLTPLLLVAADRWWRARGESQAPTMAELNEPQSESVIIAGFGRYGQIVGRLLYAKGITPTVLDHDAEQIEAMRRFGWRVHYGDATRLDLLRTAGADKARVLVLAIDDVAQSVGIASMVRQHFPHITIVARARNVQHLYALRDAGVVHIERETLDAALMSGRSVLEQLGWEPHHARTLSLRFRRHNVSQVLAMAPHWKDEARLLTAAKQGRQQLEEQFAKEREAAHRQRIRAGWTAQPRGEPVSGAEGERTLGEEDSPTRAASPHQN